MDVLVGILIWVVIFLIWYVKNYPDRFGISANIPKFNMRWPKKSKNVRAHNGAMKPPKSNNYKSLIETIESVCDRDKMGTSDAATMVSAVKKLLEIEPASGQVWEAYALDSLETAEIKCDDCKIPVTKTIKKTGVRIHCGKCNKWLALKNSKVTVIDPTRSDLEDWEK